MQTMSVAELKAHFSEVLGRVQRGEEVVISFGKRKERVAALIPFDRYVGAMPRRLGLLAGKAGFVLHEDAGLSDEEFLAS